MFLTVYCNFAKRSSRMLWYTVQTTSI